MNHHDFPALYQSSDELSLQFQKSFFRAIFWNLSFLIVGAVISVLNSSLPGLAIVQAMMLLGALASSVYLFSARPDRYWYAARAVAESIKTVTWRFITRAEPFNGSDEVDRHQLRDVLRSIVEQNRDVAQRLTSYLDGVQVTDSMMAMRQAPMERRLAHYVEHRINEQQRWYAKKSSYNTKMGRIFFSTLVIINAIAVCFAVSKIHFPNAPFWPTDAVVTLAAGLLSWIQAKRFSELSASYALAAHEISLIKEQSASINTNEELSRFAGDAENAFSREHTQWVARKNT